MSQQCFPSDRFLVVYQDTHGCRRCVGEEYDFETENGAEARVTEILAKQTKPHNVTYEIFSYAPGHRDTVIREHAIME